MWHNPDISRTAHVQTLSSVKLSGAAQSKGGADAWSAADADVVSNLLERGEENEAYGDGSAEANRPRRGSAPPCAKSKISESAAPGSRARPTAVGAAASREPRMLPLSLSPAGRNSLPSCRSVRGWQAGHPCGSGCPSYRVLWQVPQPPAALVLVWQLWQKIILVEPSSSLVASCSATVPWQSSHFAWFIRW